MYIKIHRAKITKICSRFYDDYIEKSKELNKVENDEIYNWLLKRNDISFFKTLANMADYTECTEYPYVLISADEFNRIRKYL